MFERLTRDGIEHIGTIELGAVVVVGDPVVVGRNPANGAYFASRIAAGRFDLFVRAEERDPDRIVEIIAMSAPAESFWELYDAAAPVGVLPAGAPRIAVLDGRHKDDAELRLSMYEPDADALPWVLDAAVVIAGDPAHEVVVRAAGEPVNLLTVTFGPIPFSIPSAPITVE